MDCTFTPDLLLSQASGYGGAPFQEDQVPEWRQPAQSFSLGCTSGRAFAALSGRADPQFGPVSVSLSASGSSLFHSQLWENSAVFVKEKGGSDDDC